MKMIILCIFILILHLKLSLDKEKANVISEIKSAQNNMQDTVFYKGQKIASVNTLSESNINR